MYTIVSEHILIRVLNVTVKKLQRRKYWYILIFHYLKAYLKKKTIKPITLS